MDMHTKKTATATPLTCGFAGLPVAPSPDFFIICRRYGMLFPPVLFVLQFLKILEQFLQRDSFRSRLSQQLTSELTNTAPSLEFIFLRLLVGDKRTGSLLSSQHAADFEFPI